MDPYTREPHEGEALAGFHREQTAHPPEMNSLLPANSRLQVVMYYPTTSVIKCAYISISVIFCQYRCFGIF